ncbi:hypothetical protein SAE02_42830 [Skermanella aerolata]|uniref:Uncharacterized protein n=1 Tax=Skermanella aerolata TaxID=393310 RepID=A0A512DUK1_9PROT|nr:hypothetical protein N826_07280 [Skermanella aerolata KACC 11604]GEO40135.1 hypothetical protein SAE02_42830 [Skermanella aerolata]
MTDRTAVRRVRRYRHLQINGQEIVRVDLQVPMQAADDLNSIAGEMRERYAGIGRAQREIELESRWRHVLGSPL